MKNCNPWCISGEPDFHLFNVLSLIPVYKWAGSKTKTKTQ